MRCQFLIIVPTLNSYELLPSLIDTINNQTYKHWRVLFVDGFSSEKHINFLRETCKTYKNFSWMYQSKAHEGIFAAMNDGASKAMPDEWTFFWGSDDWVSSNNIFAKLNDYIKNIYLENESPDLVICNCRYIDQYGKTSRKAEFHKKSKNVITKFNNKQFRKALFQGFIPSHQSTLFSPKSLKFIPLFRKNFKLSADLDFFLRFSKSFELNIFYINKEIIYLSNSGISSQKPLERLKEVIVSYKLSFPILFLYPIIMRYIRKVRTLF